MGTAIEMWEAHEHGRGVVVCVSPLVHNWAVRYCSHIVYPDFDTMESELKSGRLTRRIEEALVQRRAASKL